MSIKFLTDENISKSLVRALRKSGYDIKDIKEEKLFGISDIEVINTAKEENRVILTHDKHFGNLVNYPLQSHCGVVLIRYRDQSPEYVIPRLIVLLDKLKNKLNGSLILITGDLVKIERSISEKR